MRVTGAELNGLLEQRDGADDVLISPAIPQIEAAQIQRVCLGVLRRRLDQADRRASRQLDAQLARDRSRDRVLHFRDVSEGAAVSPGAQFRAACGIDELHSDPNAVCNALEVP